MATFTGVLKDFLDEDNPENWAHTIGLTDYPIFDESYRAELNDLIIQRFWNREIGQETFSLFRHTIKRRMREIMSLYNQHYEASRIKVDPFKTIDIKNVSRSEALSKGTGQSEQNTAGHSESGSTTDAKSRAVNSETPQTMLADNGDYATSAQDNVSTSGATSTAETTDSTLASSTDETEQSGTTEGEVSGFQGNAPAMMMALRASFVNVDLMVLEELESCFMLIWSSGDEFTDRGYGYAYAYGIGYRF